MFIPILFSINQINSTFIFIIVAFKAIYFVLNIWQLCSPGSLKSLGQMWNCGHCRTTLKVMATELTLPLLRPPTYKFTVIIFTGCQIRVLLLRKQIHLTLTTVFVHLLIILSELVPQSRLHTLGGRIKMEERR